MQKDSREYLKKLFSRQFFSVTARHALPALLMCINFAGTGSLCLRHACVMARASYARCFVSPAPLGLLLDLRKAPNQHALLAISVIKRLKHNTLSSNGYGASPVVKSRSRAKGPGDMSAGDAPWPFEG